MPDVVVRFREVSKSYPIYATPSARLKELLTFQRKSFHRDYWALRNVDFTIRRGETFCVIGENGAGKSTLLQLVAGIHVPSQGELHIDGRVSALLELGAGFNPEFTGRDNVFLTGSILGFTSAQISARYHSIAAFAEIGDFIDQPIKTYSSGMLVRLAFAIAIHADPDILLVDEALAVGDIYFRQRCMRKVHALRAAGVTILFVSHSMADVKSLGHRTLWLDHGAVRDLGETSRVVARYLAAMAEKDSAYLGRGHTSEATSVAPASHIAPELVDTIPNIDNRHGDGSAEIVGIAIYDAQGRPAHLLQPESSILVRISVRAKQHLASPIVGFMLRNHLGIDFAGTNTAREAVPLPPMSPGDVFTVDFLIDLPILYPSHFSFSPAVAEGTLASYRTCDWIDNAITLEMTPADGPVYGFMHLPARIGLNQPLAHSLSLAEATHG